MTTELVGECPSIMPVDSTKTASNGVLRFPTTACAESQSVCPNCDNCANDCADCEMCCANACPHCATPDLTPRTASMLTIAGTALADAAQDAALHSRSPIVLYQFAHSFERMTNILNSGEHPRPDTMADQLCAHLMISYATNLACDVGEVLVTHLPYSDYDYYFDDLYDTLLWDDEHVGLIREVQRIGRDDRVFDFEALIDSAAPCAMKTLFAPYPQDKL